jgi:hypothetical protein
MAPLQEHGLCVGSSSQAVEVLTADGWHRTSIEKLLHGDGLKINWTSVWMADYDLLFVKVPDLAEENTTKTDATVPRGGGGNLQDVTGELVFAFNPEGLTFRGCLARLPRPRVQTAGP